MNKDSVHTLTYISNLQAMIKDHKERIKELEKALESITHKAERYMENHTCNDFTAYIEHSKQVLNKDK